MCALAIVRSAPDKDNGDHPDLHCELVVQADADGDGDDALLLGRAVHSPRRVAHSLHSAPVPARWGGKWQMR